MMRGLLVAVVLTFPGVAAAQDLALTRIVSPHSFCGDTSGDMDATVEITNAGSTAFVGNATVALTFGTTFTDTVALDLAAGESTTFTLTTVAGLGFSGTQPCSASVSVAGDTNNANDGLAVTLTQSPETVAGEIQGTLSFCGPPSGSLTLVGNVGDIVSWEGSSDGIEWSSLGTNTQTELLDGILRTRRYRVRVKSGTCASEVTEPVVVRVGPAATVVVVAPQSACAETQQVASVPDAGADAQYIWAVDGGEIVSGAGTREIHFTTSGDGDATVRVAVFADGCLGNGSHAITVNATTAPVITLAEAGIAEVTANAGSTYDWSIAGGSISDGDGTASVDFLSTSGTVTLQVVETGANGCVSPVSELAVAIVGDDADDDAPIDVPKKSQDEGCAVMTPAWSCMLIMLALLRRRAS